MVFTFGPSKGGEGGGGGEGKERRRGKEQGEDGGVILSNTVCGMTHSYMIHILSRQTGSQSVCHSHAHNRAGIIGMLLEVPTQLFCNEACR